MSTEAGRTVAVGWAPPSQRQLDYLLTAQIAVAWAGEGGEEPRLGWWDSDLTSEFGGADLFKRLLPRTWRWAVLQGAREAARRRDARLRARDHDPDRIVSLFRLGHDVDERLAERLLDLRLAAPEPLEALPGLTEVVSAPWSTGSFWDWVKRQGGAEYVAAPVGRRLKGEPPADVEAVARNLLGALLPLAEEYPMPHYRRGA